MKNPHRAIKTKRTSSRGAQRSYPWATEVMPSGFCNLLMRLHPRLISSRRIVHHKRPDALLPPAKTGPARPRLMWGPPLELGTWGPSPPTQPHAHRLRAGATTQWHPGPTRSGTHPSVGSEVGRPRRVCISRNRSCEVGPEEEALLGFSFLFFPLSLHIKETHRTRSTKPTFINSLSGDRRGIQCARARPLGGRARNPSPGPLGRRRRSRRRMLPPPLASATRHGGLRGWRWSSERTLLF